LPLLDMSGGDRSDPSPTAAKVATAGPRREEGSRREPAASAVLTLLGAAAQQGQITGAQRLLMCLGVLIHVEWLSVSIAGAILADGAVC
jgi:hypothetical protein